MGVVKQMPVRTREAPHRRICDLVLHDNGKIYIVDIEQEKTGKKKYQVCINEYLEQILKLNEED